MALGTLAAAALLAFAPAFDLPELQFVALGLIAGVFIAREVWLWEGDVRGWLTMAATIALTIGALWALSEVTR